MAGFSMSPAQTRLTAIGPLEALPENCWAGGKFLRDCTALAEELFALIVL